jgi:hypothetical protein
MRPRHRKYQLEMRLESRVHVVFHATQSLSGAAMDTELAQLQRNIARIRREIQIQSREMQALIETDIDCTNAARLLMRMQADLVLFVEKRERLKSPQTA